MISVYGGLILENLVKQDEYLELQLELFRRGFIQGIQVRIAHPSFTPDVTIESLPRIFSVLPEKLGLFFHFGAENVGVDLGENFDEYGVFIKSGVKNWTDWNYETLNWGLEIIRTVATFSRIYNFGVIHPGYGKNETDAQSRNLILSTLSGIDDGRHVVIENVPPIVDSELCPTSESEFWHRKKYWGFGGTPNDMAKILKKLGNRWRCLIDFTHLIVMVNQANRLNIPLLSQWSNLKKTIEAYLELPHCSICHFSGAPNTLVDYHGMDFDTTTIPLLTAAFSQMKVVCLEIPWNPGDLTTNIKSIETFCKNYKIPI